MKPFTVPGLLRAAASYIEIHGHEQASRDGGKSNPGGPCCPIVAFIRLNPPDFRTPGCWRTGLLGTQALRALEPHIYNDIGFWSDHTPTAEVLATMRRVARELDK